MILLVSDDAARGSGHRLQDGCFSLGTEQSIHQGYAVQEHVVQ